MQTICFTFVVEKNTDFKVPNNFGSFGIRVFPLKCLVILHHHICRFKKGSVHIVLIFIYKTSFLVNLTLTVLQRFTSLVAF